MAKYHSGLDTEVLSAVLYENVSTDRSDKHFNDNPTQKVMRVMGSRIPAFGGGVRLSDYLTSLQHIGYLSLDQEERRFKITPKGKVILRQHLDELVEHL